MPVMTAAEMAAALDEIEQNGGAGALIATRVLIRPLRGCGDRLASEALTIRVYRRCACIRLTMFGTSTTTGDFALLGSRDEQEIPLSPSADHMAVMERLVDKYRALDWAQVPA